MNDMTEMDYDRKWIEDYPDLGTDPVPTEPCISDEYYQLEREKVFATSWLKVGRVEEIPEAGSYLVRDIPVCAACIVVMRGNDGAIRGFHNVCTHRGNKLVWDSEKSGKARSFRCRFHGWTFSNSGKLLAVPDEKMFYQLKKEELGLKPVAVEVWEGFIFINLDPSPKESLKSYLGEMGERIGGFPYGEMTQRYGYRAVLKANWKVCLDAFSEAYHVLTVHGQTVGTANFSKDNPMSHPIDVRLFKRHRATVVYGNPNHQPGPVAQIAAKFGRNSMERGVGMDTLPPHINPDRRPDFNFDLCAIFPNFMIHVRPGEYFTHQFWPIDRGHTVWEGLNYLPKPKTPAQKFSQEYSHLMRRNAWLEDTSAMEATYEGLASGVLKYFQLSDPEILVRHSYKVLEEHVGFYKKS